VVGPWALAGAYVVGVILLLGAMVYTFAQQEHVNQELCASTVANREADRVQWITLGRLIEPTIDTEEGRERMRALIAGVLRPIPPLECIDDKPIPREG